MRFQKNNLVIPLEFSAAASDYRGSPEPMCGNG
jgi:hypothetical protein